MYNPGNIVAQPRTLVSLCSGMIARTDAKKEEEEKISSEDEEDLYADPPSEESGWRSLDEQRSAKEARMETLPDDDVGLVPVHH